MKLEIIDKNACKSLLKQNEFKWNLFLKKAAIYFSIAYIVGIGFLLWGLSNYKEYTKKSKAEIENKDQVIHIENYSNWHLNEAIGVVIIVLTTYLFYILFNQKKRAYKLTNEVSKNVLKLGNEIHITVDDIGIKYDRHDFIIDVRWELIEKFKEYQEYYLLTVKGMIYKIIIDKKNVTTEENNIFLNLLKEKV
ncbi:MAG: hypothetical protein BM557_00245 [Flavobacterium sp. MedPE-SWcel]|mgnify:CR=1 FL=1|uniref:hypothetical protein n=1 Tax=uncultured Flavobacterium sp. TaxID=165435 RepID=UPI00091B8E52|nr:hypothetical protein [uncultured Flavobacterium sp.]OIQ22452.1 MAG: hypothetical protein BM557_00245 [Flavobacterium sp. MedPE-SWcel]